VSARYSNSTWSGAAYWGSSWNGSYWPGYSYSYWRPACGTWSGYYAPYACSYPGWGVSFGYWGGSWGIWGSWGSSWCWPSYSYSWCGSWWPYRYYGYYRPSYYYCSRPYATYYTWYDPLPCTEVYVVPTYQPSSVVSSYASAPAAAQTYIEVDVPQYRPTVYRTDELAGVLDWRDSPEVIVGAVATAPADKKDAVAAEFLGKVPAGGWPATFEREIGTGDERELWLRGVEKRPSGDQPLIVVRLKPGAPVPDGLERGQRLLATGRLAEICVDDPYELAGKLTLEDASVRPD
jgi:hypothetical protein